MQHKAGLYSPICSESICGRVRDSGESDSNNVSCQNVRAMDDRLRRDLLPLECARTFRKSKKPLNFSGLCVSSWRWSRNQHQTVSEEPVIALNGHPLLPRILSARCFTRTCITGLRKFLRKNAEGLGGMVPRIKRLLKVRNRSAAGCCEPDRKACRYGHQPWTIKRVFRADWCPERPLNLVCLPGPVQFPVWESNPRPSDRDLPLPQLADGLRQSLLEQRVQILVGRLGRVLQRSAVVGSRLADSGGVQIQ